MGDPGLHQISLYACAAEGRIFLQIPAPPQSAFVCEPYSLIQSASCIVADYKKNQQGLDQPLTNWELSRLQRYASWMRRLDMREWDLSEEIARLVLSPSDGTPPVLRLHLRELEWWLNETNISFLLKFLSLSLTSIVITTNTSFIRPEEVVESWDNGLPDEAVPIIRSAIKTFPPSLHTLHIALGVGPQTYLMEEISEFISERGETLREFGTNVVLSAQTIVHLMKLPRLVNWYTEQGPPEVVELIRHGVPNDPTSLFPSLEVL